LNVLHYFDGPTKSFSDLCLAKFLDTATIHGKKILLDTDLKIILLHHQNNFVGILKIMNNIAKNVDILAPSFSVLHNYFDNSIKLLF